MKSVAQQLRNCFPAWSKEETEKRAAEICSDEGAGVNPGGGEDKTRGYRKIFALLAMQSEAQARRIIDFTNPDGDVCDADLPLVNINGNIPVLRLDADVEAGIDRPLKCFHGWSTRDLRDFNEMQWCFLAPFFCEGKGGEDSSLYSPRSSGASVFHGSAIWNPKKGRIGRGGQDGY
jgi:hypothetical protein